VVFHSGQVLLREPVMLNRKVKAKLPAFPEGLYYAPEVRDENREHIGLHRCDVWSFGTLYHELLFGRLPEFTAQGLVLPADNYLSLSASETLRSTLRKDARERCQLSEVRLGQYETSWEAAPQPEEVKFEQRPEFSYKYYFGYEGWH
jgi:hypothetical protein